MAPMTGMMMSPTSEVTIAPNAAPMMTPTARSTTLPFMANSRNSFSIRSSFSSALRTGLLIARQSRSVDQASMDHGLAHCDPRRLADRHHRQPQGLIHLAEQRQRVFDRRRIGLDEQIDVQRHQ